MGTTLGLWVEALGLRVGIDVLLRTLPLDRVLAALSLPARANARHSSEHVEARLSRIERLTDRITRELPLTHSACLKRALLRYALLRREGLGPEFVVGVRPAPSVEGFEAHAWVCVDARPVMEREPPEFRPNFVWPAAQASARARR